VPSPGGAARECRGPLSPARPSPGFAERLYQDAEVPITHLICRTLTDLTELLNGLMHDKAKLAWGDAALSRADQVRRPEPGHAGISECQGADGYS
jgi:hypothetical protein